MAARSASRCWTDVWLRPGTTVRDDPSPSASQTLSWSLPPDATTRPSLSTARAEGSPPMACQAATRRGLAGSRMSHSATHPRRASASSEPSGENSMIGTDWSLALKTVSAVRGSSPPAARS